MMPITFADKGTEHVIQRLSGNAEMKQHLADLGFVVGGKVRVISESGGNLIVNVKESRIAIGKDLANRIMI